MKRTQKNSFGDKLRRRRVELELTQAALADALGEHGSQSQISAWETGERQPTVASLRRLAATLGCPLAELID